MPKMPTSFKAKSPAKTFKRILGYLKDYKGLLIVALFCMLANVVCNVGGTFMISIIVNRFILPLAEGKEVILGALSGVGALGGIVAIMA